MEAKKWVLFLGGVVLLSGISSFVTYGIASRVRLASGDTVRLSSEFRNWADRIALTDEQKERMSPMEDSLRKDLAKLQPELASARIDVCAALSRPTIDKRHVEAMVDRIADLERDQQRRIVRHMFAMNDVLTPDQQRMFFTMVMRSVCEECRASMRSDTDFCGHCRVVAQSASHHHGE